MKTLEIEIHQTRAEGRRVYVDYAIYEADGLANVTQEFKMFDLIEFVKSEGLNLAYLNAPDELTELDPATYLFENLDEVVGLYLGSKFEEVVV